MYMNIILILLSLGIFMRGVLFSLAKYRGLKDNILSFIKTDNPEEFLYVNKLASISYMTLGAIFSFMILIGNLCFPLFFRKYFFFVIIGTFLTDYFCKVMIDIRLKVDKQLKEWEEEDKKKKNKKEEE